MNPLTAKRRSELRAEAHTLSPVVIIGDKGLTDEVVAEIDRSLKAHELIKVRASTGERDARDAWLESICEKLGAHPVQRIGKVFVLYRENPKAAVERRPAAKPAPRTRGSGIGDKKRSGARGEVKKRGAGRGDHGKAAAERDDVKRTSRPRSRTPSPRPESEPRRRRRPTSR
jgi:RNA-binding protein